MNLDKVQKQILENKKNKGFDYTDMSKQFLHLYDEVSEAFDAYNKKKDDL